MITPPPPAPSGPRILTDLKNQIFPSVTLGRIMSPKVAAKHYLQITEDHFKKMVQFPVQNTAVLARMDSQQKNRDFDKPFICKPMQKKTTPCENMESSLLGLTGLELNNVNYSAVICYEIQRK